MTMDCSKYLIDTVPEIVAFVNRYASMPSLDHCVGKGKLIGSLYGKSIMEECIILDETHSDDLTVLSCLLRSYIVLDDYLKDSSVPISQERDIRFALKAIRDQSLEIVRRSDSDPIALWSKYSLVYESTFKYFDPERIYQSIINKCYLAFLPFDLSFVRITDRCNDVRAFMMDYLFCLQLLDDFQDMEEDLCSSNNHNIFLQNLSHLEAEHIIRSRALIIRNLLDCVGRELHCIHKKATGPTTRLSLEHSIRWIADNQEWSGNLPLRQVINGPVRCFRFDASKILKEEYCSSSELIPSFSDLCAENMHTIT
jgi:hypothetical protein